MMKAPNKKWIGYLTASLLSVTAITGIGTGLVKAKASAAPAVPAVTQTATAGNQTGREDDQQPLYTASIRVTEPQNNEQDEANQAAEARQEKNEQNEAASFKELVKITPNAAKAAALKAVPGQVTNVALDNENGNLVYSVNVKTATGTADVKVDAGSGRVLARDSGQDEEKGGADTEQETGSNGDLDQQEVEQ
jgi:uncharacterized membrane protein YkoI